MAKKKPEEPKKGSPEWMATFSDLMNLLLCFFVLLFSMSSIDNEKWEKVVESLQNSFSVFSGGGSALSDGILISSGVSQLNELSEYYSNLGVDIPSNETEGENAGGFGEEKDQTGGLSEEELVEQYQEQMKGATEELYGDVADVLAQYHLEDYMELGLDSAYNYVQLSISGYLLFDSGKADIKEDAKPILNKASEVLKHFEDFEIKIEGHTDNVPMTDIQIFPNNLWLSSGRACAVYDYLVDTCGMDPEMLEASGKGEYHPIASNKTPEGRQKNRRVEIKIYSKIAE